MRRSSLLTITAAIILLPCLRPGTVSAQFDWTKEPTTPVLRVGLPGAWDDGVAIATTVMFHNNVYKMWYEGDGGFGYATSTNGIGWTKHAANPVLRPGEVGAWDEREMSHASVVLVGGLYRMWYSGVDAQGDNRIGHATSPNGITWTKYGTEPVLGLGPPGSWDDHEVIHPTVLYENGLYRMWYNGVDATEQRILYAWSPDGIQWTRYTVRPMLEPGPPGSWDDDELGPLCVLPHAGRYLMWYTGWNQVPEFQIGLASSPDGITWTKITAHSPVLSPGEPGSWDGDLVGIPNVLHEGEQFRMWYGGGGGVYQTGHAVSPDRTAVGDQPVPERLSTLDQNQPNPFNPRTTIHYHLASTAAVSIDVFDVSGRLVRRLVGSEVRAAGTHVAAWDGQDSFRQPVASGTYFCRLVAPGVSEVRRMTLVK